MSARRHDNILFNDQYNEIFCFHLALQIGPCRQLDSPLGLEPVNMRLED